MAAKMISRTTRLTISRRRDWARDGHPSQRMSGMRRKRRRRRGVVKVTLEIGD
jgi:hypothetical protein